MIEYKTKHDGWFYFCPVHVYDFESEAPGIEPRHWSLEPALWAAQHFGGFCIFVASMFGAEPAWCIRLGKTLEDNRK